MLYRLTILPAILFFCIGAGAQKDTTASCGQHAVMQHLFFTHPEYKVINDQIEQQLAERNRAISAGTLKMQKTAGIVTLPVVVHIIHNNGAENISDAQVFQGIQHLNEAYANSGYYDPADGVNTQIQFCMAQRDPSNNATNGITRHVSTYTVMGGASYYADDQNVKDIVRWNPLCYINIWLVKSIPGSVVGYAYLPSAHGSNVDGIIIEAAYFGSSYSNDVVNAHEMGHYLGLYHTFEGGCTNNDCTADGDRVCDTPPDQSTAGISCNSSVNSCTTDVLSGFATDQNDLTQDYMDYGNFNCMKVFTQGQADRMNWFLQHVRMSLLACKSCMNPCPAPLTAGFTAPGPPITAGTAYTFTNTSVNAASYEWYINGMLESTAVNLNYTFPATGNYTVKLVARSGSALCDDAVSSININVICGVMAGFTKSVTTAAAGTNINFNNTSTGANNYQWLVNGTMQSTTANFVYTSTTAGDYIIQLVAENSTVSCRQVYTDTVHYTCAVVTSFTPVSTAALINTAVTFTSTGTGATTYQWLVNGVAAGTGSSLTYTFAAVGAYTIQLVSGNGICSAAKYGTVYVNDQCGHAQFQFQKSFITAQGSNVIDIRATGDGGMVTAGVANARAGMLKIDAAGNNEWFNTYGNNINSSFKKIRLTRDGGYVAIGNFQTPGTQGSQKIFVVKTTASGAVSWNRELTIANTFSSLAADIIASADGNYYFVGTNEQPSVIGSSDVLVGKLDGSGNLLWSIGYDARSSETGNGLAEDNNHIVICGNKGGQQGSPGFLLQLNKSDGSIVWARTYQSTIENFVDVQVTPDGYFVNGIRSVTAAGGFSDHVYLKTDFSGKLVYSKYIRPFGTSKDLGWANGIVKANGNIISQTTTEFGGNYYDFLIQEINPAAGILWSKKYNRNNTWMRALDLAPDNNIWSAGYSLEPIAVPLQAFVMKLDSVGNAGSCSSSSVDIPLLQADYIMGIADFTGKAVQVQSANNSIVNPVDITVNTVCQYVKCDSVPPPADTCKLCKLYHLSGPDSICSFSNMATYTVKRSPGCPAIPGWSLTDTTYGRITVVNDSTINILFNKTGMVMLYTSIHTGCALLQDSLPVHIFQSPTSIDLGPDIQLCHFSTLKLSAGAGFTSYHWSDGSTDSTLTAYNTGQYSVTAVDYCGNSYHDTINITPAPVVPFTLGPDLVKCNHDTLTISAPGSFSKYTWAENYHINTTSGNIVKVWPDADTTYTVIAEVAKGCTVVDTIRITVRTSPPVQLGNDTSFCAGNVFYLKAPAGFAQYVWQDGSTSNTFNAANPGLYTLQATAANGCSSRDSLTIKSVYPLPVNFLPPTAELCDGKSIELKSQGNWSSYLWFNNSSSSAVTVSATGHYWLQVTSANGCSAKDTIVVSKGSNCMTGIFFPNAFTPDNNGSNDTYKPIVMGTPVNFKLSVYNRFGEKVFETTDYKLGWNGLYKAQQQPSGGFVWYCLYQFAGASAKTAKGTMVLIR